MFVSNIVSTFQNILNGTGTSQRIQVIRVNLKVMFNSSTMFFFLSFPLNSLWTQGVCQPIQLHFGKIIITQIKKWSRNVLSFMSIHQNPTWIWMSLFLKVCQGQIQPASPSSHSSWENQGANTVSNHTRGVFCQGRESCSHRVKTGL